MLPFAPPPLKGDGEMSMYILTMLFVRSFFAYPSLILRSERLVPILFLYRLYIY